jgi:hypothetical protein
MVTVGRYLVPMDAELDRIKLAQAGIHAVVRAGTEFNPMLMAAGGETRLEVDPGEAESARKILRAIEPARDDDDEDTATVRCPMCEGPYCYYERPKLRGVAPGAATAALAVTAVIQRGKERWTCHTCGHRWDDPREGAHARARLEVDDPVPVFRLRRSSAGMGAFLGLGTGVLLLMIFGSGVASVAVLALGFGGWLAGRAITSDLCSEPQCREPAPPGAETCGGCGGVFSGVISRANEHPQQVAEAKRAIVRDREAQGRKPASQPKKRRARRREGPKSQ